MKKRTNTNKRRPKDAAGKKDVPKVYIHTPTKEFFAESNGLLRKMSDQEVKQWLL